MSVTLDKEVACGHLSVQSIALANDDVGAKLAALQAAVDRLTAMRHPHGHVRSESLGRSSSGFRCPPARRDAF